MAHELVSGVFGSATTPWHFAETGADGRSIVVDGLLTTERMLELSGIGKVGTTRKPVYQLIKGKPVEVPGHIMVVDNETDAVLGMHTDNYVISDFRESFEALGFASDAAVWETGVLLRERKMAAGVLRLPDLDTILPDGSNLAAYIAAYTSHDGTYALTYKDSNIRIECANRLRMADSENVGRRFTIHHRAGLEAKRAEAAHIVTYAQERVDAHGKLCERLLRTKLDSNRADAILAELVPFTEGDTAGQKASRTRAQNVRGTIKAIMADAPDLADVKGSAWGFVQAVGAYTDHGITYRPTKMSSADERRFIRTVIDGNTLAERALATILAAPDLVPAPVKVSRSRKAAVTA